VDEADQISTAGRLGGAAGGDRPAKSICLGPARSDAASTSGWKGPFHPGRRGWEPMANSGCLGPAEAMGGGQPCSAALRMAHSDPWRIQPAAHADSAAFLCWEARRWPPFLDDPAPRRSGPALEPHRLGPDEPTPACGQRPGLWPYSSCLPARGTHRLHRPQPF